MSLLPIGWNGSRVPEKGNTAFGSTTSGEFVFAGTAATLMKLKSSITIEVQNEQ